MVMISDPELVRALYTNPANGLPPGRSFTLMPLLGPRSVLLLEGREHLGRRKVMLPPFHGARMREYEDTVRDVVARDVESWPEGEPFAIHPHMQRVTLEVILRAVFGVTDEQRRRRLAEGLTGLLGSTVSGRLQLRVLISRRFGGPNPLDKLRVIKGQVDELLGQEIRERREDPREDILSMLVTA